MDKTFIPTDTSFLNSAFIPMPFFLFDYYTIDGKRVQLTGNEKTLYCVIARYATLSSKSDKFKDEIGLPFCSATQETLASDAGLSCPAVKRCLDRLVKARLIIVRKMGHRKVDHIYLLSKEANTTVFKDKKEESLPNATLDSNTTPRGVSNPTPDWTTYIDGYDIDRGGARETGDIKTNEWCDPALESPNDRLEHQTQPHESPNGDCQEKSLAQDQLGESEEVRSNYVESPPSEERSLNQDPARTFPTSPNATQQQNVDRSGGIKPKLNMEAVLDCMYTLLKEDMADPKSELTQEVVDATLDFITKQSASNGYPKPSQSYMENPNVLAMGLAQQGHFGVYTSLYAHYGRECP